MLCCAVNLCSSLTHRLFKQKVSKSKSSVKISDQVDRNNPKLIEAVFWSSLLDNVFKENLENDPELRYVITHQLTDVFSDHQATKCTISICSGIHVSRKWLSIHVSD